MRLNARDLTLIALLDQNYSSHRFRYIVTGTMRVPELDALASVTERVVGGLERYCTGMVWGRYKNAA